jgi:hypothetical protein
MSRFETVERVLDSVKPTPFRWSLEHSELTKEPQDHGIYAKARVTLKCPKGVVMTLSETGTQEYYQSSRTALMNSAYVLEQVAREMKSQAERMR